MAEICNSVLSEFLDKHVPIKKKTITIHPVSPWYSHEISIAKKDKRNAEKQWRHSGLAVHKEIYSYARNHVTLIARSNEEFYKERISLAT